MVYYTTIAKVLALQWYTYQQGTEKHHLPQHRFLALQDLDWILFL